MKQAIIFSHLSLTIGSNFIYLYMQGEQKVEKSFNLPVSIWTRVIIPPLGYAYNREARFRSSLIKFMKPRFGPKLVYLDIPVMNTASLRFLDQKCPNLLSLSMCVQNPSLDISIIPSRLTFLELRVGTGSGHARRDWWMCVTSENFPNLKGLSVITGMIVPPERMNWSLESAFATFFNQIGKFEGLRYLKLSIMWFGVYMRQRPPILQQLHPAAKTLESFSIEGGIHGDDWIPEQIYQFIGEEMKGLKNIKVSGRMNSQEDIDQLKHFAKIPGLQSLYLRDESTLVVLKEILPLYEKLTDLYLYDVDNKIQVHEWVYDERRCKCIPRRRIDRDAWKSTVETLKGVRPDVKYHLIEDRKNHRMASAFC